jgi:lycopene beta-cyclase
MDFRAGSERPVHFTYVLPFTAQTALIEDTVFTAGPPDDGARRANIERYVAEFLGTEIDSCDGEERGAIPLDAARPPRPTRRVVAVGGAGGAIRASSGYAFLRTQQHARALARAIRFDRPLPALPARTRHRVLDAALLALLQSGAIRAPQFFSALFRYSDPDALVRFLSDASQPRDEARVLAALLPRPA